MIPSSYPKQIPATVAEAGERLIQLKKEQRMLTEQLQQLGESA